MKVCGGCCWEQPCAGRAQALHPSEPSHVQRLTSPATCPAPGARRTSRHLHSRACLRLLPAHRHPSSVCMPTRRLVKCSQPVLSRGEQILLQLLWWTTSSSSPAPPPKPHQQARQFHLFQSCPPGWAESASSPAPAPAPCSPTDAEKSQGCQANGEHCWGWGGFRPGESGEGSEKAKREREVRRMKVFLGKMG